VRDQLKALSYAMFTAGWLLSTIERLVLASEPGKYWALFPVMVIPWVVGLIGIFWLKVDPLKSEEESPVGGVAVTAGGDWFSHSMGFRGACQVNNQDGTLSLSGKRELPLPARIASWLTVLGLLVILSVPVWLGLLVWLFVVVLVQRVATVQSQERFLTAELIRVDNSDVYLWGTVADDHVPTSMRWIFGSEDEAQSIINALASKSA